MIWGIIIGGAIAIFVAVVVHMLEDAFSDEDGK
jgi:hypothetical protein